MGQTAGNSSGATTLVVGAASGIGRACAVALADSGRRVILLDRDLDGLEGTASLVGAACLRAEQVDIRSEVNVRAAVAGAEAQCGPIDGLAHVAGIFATGSVLDTPDAEWRDMFDVNVFGMLNVVRAVGDRMRSRRAGSIVVVGSNAAGVPRMGMGAYGSSKAAATMIVKILGLELGQYGIRTNVVAPGSTDTPIQRGTWERMEGDGQSVTISGELATFKPGIPLGRIADPEDVADAVEFLLSDRAKHITMQSLYVDGGASLR